MSTLSYRSFSRVSFPGLRRGLLRAAPMVLWYVLGCVVGLAFVVHPEEVVIFLPAGGVIARMGGGMVVDGLPFIVYLRETQMVLGVVIVAMVVFAAALDGCAFVQYVLRRSAHEMRWLGDECGVVFGCAQAESSGAVGEGQDSEQSFDERGVMFQQQNDDLEQRLQACMAELAATRQALAEEVAARQQVAAQVRQMTGQIQSMFMVFPAMYFWLDADCRFTDVMAQHADSGALVSNVEVGMSVRDALPSALWVPLFDAIGVVHTSATLIKLEYALLVGGCERFFEARLLPLSEGRTIISVRDITDRKQAEESLRLAEVRFRTLVEQMPVITYIAALDALNSTLYISPQIESMLGFSQVEWMADGAFWLSRVHPDDHERVVMEIAAAQVMYEPLPMEYRLITRDGEAKWFQDVSVVVSDDDGSPMFVQGVMVDVTRRKRAEQRSLAFAALGRQLSVATTAEAAARVIADVSAELLGWDAFALMACSDDVQALDDLLVIEVVDGQRVEVASSEAHFVSSAMMQSVFFSGAQLLSSVPMSRDGVGEGGAVFGSMMSVPLRFGGMAIGVLAIWRCAPGVYTTADLGVLQSLADHCSGTFARIRSEVSLRESEHLYRVLFDQANDAIFLEDAEDRIIDANRRACELLGYTRAELCALRVGDIQAPEMRVFPIVGEAARSLDVPFEGLHVHRDGRRIPVEITNSYVSAHGERLVLSIVRDRTERKRAEDAQRFLVEASALSSSSLDYEATLKVLADVSVPFLTDWCSIHMGGGDRSAQRVVESVADPAKRALLDELHRSYSLDRDADYGYSKVIRTGQSYLVSEISRAALVGFARDPRHAELLTGVGLCSLMCVPLIARGRTLGAMTFAALESGRHYGADDLTLAEDLARRAALAVDNARLFADLQESQRHYRSVVENVEEVIFQTDTAARWSFLNPAWTMMTGFTGDETLGRPLIDFIYPDDREQARALLADLVSGAKADCRCQIRYVTKSGGFRWVEARAHVLADAGDGVASISGTLSDITDRRAAEVALQDLNETLEQHVIERTYQLVESEARYRLLAENATDIISRYTLGGRWLYVSPACYRLLGYTQDELIGSDALDYIHPDDRQSVRQAHGAIVGNADTLTLSFRMLLRDGSFRWFEATSRSVRSADDGAVEELFSVLRDITQRKAAEDLVKQTERRYRELFDAAPMMYVITRNDEGKPVITDCNELFLRTLGYTRAEVLEQSLVDFYTPQSQAKLLRGGYQQALEGHFVAQERELLARDGRVIPALLHALPEVSLDGLTSGTRAMFVDITERKRTEEALRESEERYRRIVETAEEGIWIIDIDGLTLFVNRKMAEMLGYGVEEVLGQPMFLFMDAEDRASAVVNIERHRQGMTRQHDLKFRRKDGNELWVLISTTSILDEKGRYAGVLGMLTDITERKRIEAALELERVSLARRVEEHTTELRAANADLARAAHMKDEFLASMSHELRTPLNTILGMAETLQECIYGPLTDEQVEAIQSIEGSGRHLLALINDILDLSKIEAGKLELEIEPVVVEQLCQASIRMIKQAAHLKQLKISLQIDPAVTILRADERRLKQILVNLLSNAVKFTPHAGTIGLEVTGDLARHLVRFAVWDTGIGIAQEDISRLFQPFVQLDSRLARRYTGTGLGLALVARMVELNSGSVTVESEVGEGSRFTITLPWQEPDVAIQPSDRGQAMRADTSRGLLARRVLVIMSPSPESQQLIYYLRTLGAEVIVHPCGTGSGAVTMEVRPDIIVIEAELSDLSGWDVLTRIKIDERMRGIPVLITSGTDERPRALALGATEWLLRPFDQAQMEAVVYRLVSQPLPHAPASFSDDDAAKPLGTPTILLAEDDLENIAMFSRYIRSRGYQVIVAHNGVEALARAREVRPDLILMDMQMPEMDGLETTRRIRANDDLAAIPIIALTALAMAGDADRCLAAGANAYMSKPVRLRELILLIESHLQRKQSDS